MAVYPERVRVDRIRAFRQELRDQIPQVSEENQKCQLAIATSQVLEYILDIHPDRIFSIESICEAVNKENPQFNSHIPELLKSLGFIHYDGQEFILNSQLTDAAYEKLTTIFSS